MSEHYRFIFDEVDRVEVCPLTGLWWLLSPPHGSPVGYVSRKDAEGMIAMQVGHHPARRRWELVKTGDDVRSETEHLRVTWTEWAKPVLSGDGNCWFAVGKEPPEYAGTVEYARQLTTGILHTRWYKRTVEVVVDER